MKTSPKTSPIVEGRVDRRRLLGTAALGAAGATALPAILAACGSSTTAAGSEGLFPSHPKWNFVFVNHVTTNAFFTPTQYGAADASAAAGMPVPMDRVR